MLSSCGGGGGSGGSSDETDPPDPYPQALEFPVVPGDPILIHFNTTIDGSIQSINQNTIRVRTGTQHNLGWDLGTTYSLTNSGYTVRIHPNPVNLWDPRPVGQQFGDPTAYFYLYIPDFGDGQGNNGTNMWLRSTESETTFMTESYRRYAHYDADADRVYGSNTLPLLHDITRRSDGVSIFGQTLPLNNPVNINFEGDNFHSDFYMELRRNRQTLAGWDLNVNVFNTTQGQGQVPTLNTAGLYNIYLTNGTIGGGRPYIDTGPYFSVIGVGTPIFDQILPTTMAVDTVGNPTVTITGDFFYTVGPDEMTVFLQGIECTVQTGTMTTTQCQATVPTLGGAGGFVAGPATLVLSNADAGGGSISIDGAVIFTD
ncbi:hypothetical protein ACFL54_08030 [Planctomycetota bacterium]